MNDEPSSGAESGAPDPRDDPPRRVWLPLAVSAMGVIVVIGSVASFGALQEEEPLDPIAREFETSPEPEDEPFVPPAREPRSLKDTVPGLSQQLTLIARGPNGPTVLVWNPSFAQPRPAPIAYNGAHTAEFSLDDAAFDAGGRIVKISGLDTKSERRWLWVGSPTDVSPNDLFGVVDSIWHASNPGHIAWLTDTPTGELTLFTSRIDPLSLDMAPATELATLPPGTRLVRWDTQGFVVDSGPNGVIALDPVGVELWQTDGSAIAASDTTVVVAEAVSPPTGSNDAGFVTAVVLVDRDGTVYADLFDDQPVAEQTHRSVWIASSNDLVARVDVIGQSTKLSVTGGPLVAIRQLRLSDDVLPLGFTANDQFFVFEADGSNDLIFVNWNAGSIHEVSVPDQYSIVGFTTN